MTLVLLFNQPVAKSVSPGVGAITFTGFAPTITFDTVVLPGAGSAVFTGNAPSIAAGNTVLPGAGSVLFTGAAPVVTFGNTVLPGAGSVLFTGAAPSIAAGNTVLPGAGAIIFTGAAPTIAAGNTVLPGVGSVLFTGFAPNITAASGATNVNPGVGSLLFTGFAPTILAATAPINIVPGAGNLSFIGFPPSIVLTPFPFNYGLTNAGIFMEAFDRVQIRPHDISRHEILSVTASLNEALQDWTNETATLWSVVSGTITLAPGTVVYDLPSNLAQLFDVTLVVGTESGIMLPMQRSQYAAIVNKLELGVPKYYWFQMLIQPQITIWQAPQAAGTLEWWGLQRLQDATLGSGEVPNIPYRGIDALCANVALRLCEKVGKRWMRPEKTLFAKAAWEKLQHRDQELGNTVIQPMTRKYRRLK